MKHNPYKIVEMFEEEVADYTGAPYAVSVDSCTNALFLCCVYKQVEAVTIPSKTYLSVPQAAYFAGAQVFFDPSMNDWQGIYQLRFHSIYDAAKRFTSNMYLPGSLMCLSFHIKKTLGIGKGGMVLTDSKEAVDWFKTARYEGRSEVAYGQDNITSFGWNMYMTPVEAAVGLTLMQQMPQHNLDQIEKGGYRDLREFPLFEDFGVVNDE